MLHCLSSVIEEKILQCSSYFSIMTDESKDITVLKQLVLVGIYQMSDRGVKTSFLHIQDMKNGKAETIKEAILKF